MAALTIHPAGPALPDVPVRHLPVTHTRRRGHLALVGEDFGEVAGAEAAHLDGPAPRRQDRLVLTQRGRQVLGALAFVLATVLAVGLGAGAAALTAGQPAVESVTVVTVGPGESLWSIAATIAQPGQDVREVIAQITALNELPGDVLRAGQELRVPQG